MVNQLKFFLQILLISFFSMIPGLYTVYKYGSLVSWSIFTNLENNFFIFLIITAFIFSAVCFLFFNFIVYKYKVKSIFIIFILNIISCGISLYVGELISIIIDGKILGYDGISGNFSSYLMTFYGMGFVLFMPIFSILATVLFKYRSYKEIDQLDFNDAQPLNRKEYLNNKEKIIDFLIGFFGIIIVFFIINSILVLVYYLWPQKTLIFIATIIRGIEIPLFFIFILLFFGRRKYIAIGTSIPFIIFFIMNLFNFLN